MESEISLGHPDVRYQVSVARYRTGPQRGMWVKDTNLRVVEPMRMTLLKKSEGGRERDPRFSFVSSHI